MTIFCISPLLQNDVSGLLAYSLKVCMSLMQNKKFRNEVLRVLVKLYMNLEKPDFINVCQVKITVLSLLYNKHEKNVNCMTPFGVQTARVSILSIYSFFMFICYILSILQS